jgi:hypothetical protein
VRHLAVAVAWQPVVTTRYSIKASTFYDYRILLPTSAAAERFKIARHTEIAT